MVCSDRLHSRSVFRNSVSSVVLRTSCSIGMPAADTVAWFAVVAASSPSLAAHKDNATFTDSSVRSQRTKPVKCGAWSLSRKTREAKQHPMSQPRTNQTRTLPSFVWRKRKHDNHQQHTHLSNPAKSCE